jgi:protocatechuate 3,4-dioxygenase beta subunit
MKKQTIILSIVGILIAIALLGGGVILGKNLFQNPNSTSSNPQSNPNGTPPPRPNGTNPRGQGTGGYTLTAEQKKTCGITVSATEGPFYISNTKQLPENKNLNFKNYSGTKLTVSGHVYSGETGTTPVKNAKIEIWQVGTDKSYHPQANGDYPSFKPEDFGNRGFITTGENGEYTFDTVSPMLYEGRARHIHFRITGTDHNGITTQLIMPENGDSPSPENDNVASGLPNCQIINIDKTNGANYQVKFDFRLKSE